MHVNKYYEKLLKNNNNNNDVDEINKESRIKMSNVHKKEQNI